MNVNLPKPGNYVVAVSGGIDSVCLLDLLVKTENYELIVAHYDHGIRANSSEDCSFVQALAHKYKISFITERGDLGPEASEAEAREARYQFLRRIAKEYQAKAIITAHHQDDRIETLFINLIRGTGRKGLSALKETEEIKRPFLSLSKNELKSYALQHNLSWVEDSTNTEERYLRNYIRLRVLPRMSEEDKNLLHELMDRQEYINKELDELLFKFITKNDIHLLSRKTINGLPFNESKELVASWLRANNLLNFDHKTIERLTLAAKTKRPGTKLDVYNQARVTINKEFLALDTVER